MKWFTKNWWKYLLEKPAEETNRLVALWCRAKGHKDGVVWYTSVNATEPDMRCKKCFDDLG